MLVEPVKLPQNSEQVAQLKGYLRRRITGLKEGLQPLHETKLPKWRKAYESVPQEPIREFPFHNASNLVVPIIAIHSDTLLARVMSAIIKTRPLWVCKVLGNHPDAPLDLKESLEEFLAFVGLEPQELDLYRVYHEFFAEAIKFGTSVLKLPWVQEVEDQVEMAGDGSGKPVWTKRTMYEGPRPEKLAFEDFYYPVNAKTLEGMDFKAHKVRLQRHTLEERAYRGIYDKEETKVVLQSPDITSPDKNQQDKQQSAGMSTEQGYQEWHVYECWFRYRVGSRYCRLIVWFHERTTAILRAYFQYYPTEPFVSARLFYRDDMYPGYGFCETLGMLQEEISQIHNNRRDNSTVANTKVWRVSPDSKLHQGYQIFPSAMLPAEKDEIEPLDSGQVSPMTIDEERLTLELADRRSGVSPPQQGAGAGFNTKRGIYTAMGTLSILQEGNNRTDLNISDIRYAHAKIGRILAQQYAVFGVEDSKLASFGKDAPKIRAALDAVKNGTWAIPIQSSTASINREVEKQNFLMLTQVFSRHYQMVAGILQAISNPALPENMRKYLTDTTRAADHLMRTVSKLFDIDEPDRVVPEPELGQAPQAGAPANGQSSGGGTVLPPGASPLLASLLTQQGRAQ
jgi:hypothetical protein